MTTNRILRTLVPLAFIMMSTSGCVALKTTTKVAALPVKGVMKTTELAGKGVYYTGKGIGKGIYYTGKGVGKGIYHTGRLTGKGIYNTGKAVYYIGKVPIVITDKALDTSIKVLTITTLATDQVGKVVATTRQIQAAQLDAELSAIQGLTNVLKVIVDAASGN